MELLCPAGNKESLIAAINSGANAVYLSGKRFGARAFAANFSNEELKEAIRIGKVYGVKIYVTMNTLVKENEIEEVITETLEKYKPDIVVITGHDFLKKHAKDKTKIENYQNSENFVNAIKKARIYEKNQDKLIIISGACQSNYEELIKAGSNFASSPKRINIHALDPAIIASYLALYDRNKTVDLIDLLGKTKSGSEGMGGVVTKGCMFVGYPR